MGEVGAAGAEEGGDAAALVREAARAVPRHERQVVPVDRREQDQVRVLLRRARALGQRPRRVVRPVVLRAHADGRVRRELEGACWRTG